MSTMRRRSERGTAALLSVAVAAALLVLPDAAASQQATGTGEVTFASDVAPIFYENCVSCHQENGMGPMSLITYDEVAPWAPVIKDRVESRFMPPWHVDRTVGIQEFKDDISLTDAEIETIARWVDAGAPQGDPDQMPPAPDFPDRGEWQLEAEYGRPPDLIIFSDPYTVPASGLDKWWYPVVPVEGIDEPRAVMATESRPSIGSYAVTHHANSNVSKYAVGKPYDKMPANVGLLIEPGHEVSFNIHYFPNGEEVKDAQLEIGMWFYPQDEEPRIVVPWSRATASFSSLSDTDGPEAQTILIPPHGTQVTQGVTVLDKPGMIYSVRGHQHTHGAGQLIEAIYPDGRREVLNRVGWQFGWHITYTYEDDAAPLLPAGTVILITAWYDNTERPGNPDPDQWVIYGRRSADDMSHMHIGYVEMEQEDFDWMVEQRRMKQQEEQVVQQGG